MKKLLGAAALALALTACARDGQIADGGVYVTRSTCPQVAIPAATGDVTLFDPAGSTDSRAIDVVATITNEVDGYANEVVERLKAVGVRAEGDTRADKIGYKVREHSRAKVPVMFVVGKREAEEGTASVRRLGSQDQQVLGLDDAIKAIAAEAVPPDLAKSQARAA